MVWLRLLHDAPSRYNSPAVRSSTLRAVLLQVRNGSIGRAVDLDLGPKGNALLPPVPLSIGNSPGS